MMKRIFLFFLLAALVVACTDDDSFTTSSSARLTFSADTLKMDTVFSNVGSRTYTFWVYNRTDKGLRLNTVRLAGGNQTGFRVNVDGTYLDNSLGSVVNNLEVRKGDSLRVFVELTSPETRQLEPKSVIDDIVFQLESGVEQRVRLQAWAWDALKWIDPEVTHDTIIDSRIPIVIYGKGLSVKDGVVLTLRGTTLYFHDQAGIDVYGGLVTEGGVLMRGDRLDRMFDYLPYDRVSGQWRGLWFAPTSIWNRLTDTEIRNASTAICLTDSSELVESRQRLVMTRCIVHNAKGHGVVIYNSNVSLRHCQLTNTLGDCLAVYGGLCEVDHCTIAQFYPFVADRGAALRFSNHWGDRVYDGLSLTCTNSIVTGYADDVIFGEQTEPDGENGPTFNYRFSHCLLRTPVVEGDSIGFQDILWETNQDTIQGKKHFVKIDEENLYYDFHLDSLSTAQGMGCY